MPPAGSLPIYAAIATVFAACITASIAFLGIIISKENKTSEFRQEWINELRNDISSFLATANIIRRFVSWGARNLSEEKKSGAITDFVAPKHAELSEVRHKIRLRLNPKEDDHIELIGSIESIVDLLMPGKPLGAAQGLYFDQFQAAVVASSQVILKEEWQRVKRGEPWFYRLKWSALTLVVLTLLAAVIVLIGQL
ncbi:hypothetical protein [Azohydromonas lata]|uniref:Uncharacterized protein n=1 Tax=Azohydromonas lata TaxID=45677 RepID=A0ABU5IIU5_9BURK|nr:hypothetical protein [Azohydromonas lata]MDZ5458013.1 hypothetical protein [Azohydromonas lata]